MKWETNVRRVEPYVPGEQPSRTDIIKLNTNECPYPPAPGVQKAMEKMDVDAFRLYPDKDSLSLTHALAEYYHVNQEQIFVGVGSDDVLALSFLTFFNNKKPILFPDITYSFYDVWAQLYRIPYKQLPLDENFYIRTEDYLQDNGGIVIANPNAPTGIFKPVSEIEEIIQANRDVIVIVDEAYIDFGAESVLPLVDKYDNLLVVQTFSKSRSMAGMRIGFAIGQPKLIRYLSDAKFSINSYTMNYPTLQMGAEAVKDVAYFKSITDKIIKTREWTKDELTKSGFICTDSKTNFLFVTHPVIKAEAIVAGLKKEGIYVRYWNKPRISNYMRITIGTDEQMKTCVEFLRRLCIS